MVAHGLGLLVLLAAHFFFHAGTPTRQTVVFGLLAGFLGGIGLMAFYQALSLGSMGLVAALSGVLAAFIPVVVSFFTEGRPSALKLAGFVVAGAAIWLIAYTPESAVHPNVMGLAVLSGIFFGVLLVLLHIAGKGGVLWAMTFLRVGSLSSAVVFGALIALRSRAKPESGPTPPPRANWRAVLPVAAAAGLLDTTGNLLFTFSSLAGRLDVAAVLSSLYPGGTILLAVWLLKERATRSQTVGMVLALIAVLMVSS